MIVDDSACGKTSQLTFAIAQGDQLAVARSYLRLGLSVIPVRTDGTKAPIFDGWREFSERRPTIGELVSWFSGLDRYGIGIPGGPASGNLVVFDFERWEAFGKWGASLTDNDRFWLSRCPVIRTPSGGVHIYIRLLGLVKGSKYAREASGKCLIETRGNGHQVVAPGSPASCHRTGMLYRVSRIGWLDGGPCEPMPLEEFNQLCLNAAKLNEYSKPAAERIVGDRPGTPAGDRPGDHFNARVSWGDILKPAGWTIYSSSGSVIFWCRPDKSPQGVSATTGFCKGPSGNDLFYPFTTSAPPFEAETSYSRFCVYAILNHRGDFFKASRTLGMAGYGLRRRKEARA